MDKNEVVKVLIVDDEERFRTNTAAILNKRGFAATAVGSGMQALQAVKEHPFDVVILDLKMPEMNGNEALLEIKRIKPEIEVIMLTGYGTMRSALESLRQGVFDYLTKPCDVDGLTAKIRRAYAKKAGLARGELRVKHVMVPLQFFSTIRDDGTVAEAIDVIMRSFQTAMSTGTVHESLHRSTLVLDGNGKVVGVLSFGDLLAGLEPAAYRELIQKGSLTPDSMHLGMFTAVARDLVKKKVKELMSAPPPTINVDADLLEAAHRLVTLKAPRLLVTDGSKTVGVIREQDLFFEIANITRGRGTGSGSS